MKLIPAYRFTDANISVQYSKTEREGRDINCLTIDI